MRVADFNYLIPAFFPLYNPDIPLPDLKMGRQDLDQGLVGPPLHGRSGQIDLETAFFLHYFILFCPGDYPDGMAHSFYEKKEKKPLIIRN